jgi:hypothetical protein
MQIGEAERGEMLKSENIVLHFIHEYFLVKYIAYIVL